MKTERETTDQLILPKICQVAISFRQSPTTSYLLIHRFPTSNSSLATLGGTLTTVFSLAECSPPYTHTSQIVPGAKRSFRTDVRANPTTKERRISLRSVNPLPRSLRVPFVTASPELSGGGIHDGWNKVCVIDWEKYFCWSDREVGKVG